MYKFNKKAFTLIEVLVSITIFSIIILLVSSLFSNIVLLSKSIDITRAMQENVKNIVEIISDDILNNGISLVNSDINLNISTNTWTILYVWNKNYYYIAKYNNNNFIIVNNNDNECKNSNCYLVTNYFWSTEEPVKLSNNQIRFEDFYFSYSTWAIDKISINFVMKPAFNFSSSQNSQLIFQTTISEKLIKTN